MWKEIQKHNPAKLIPPFQKGDGKDFSTFTLFVEGSSTSEFYHNDLIVVEGFTLRVVGTSFRPDDRIFEESYELYVQLFTDILKTFTLKDYRNTIVFKTTLFNNGFLTTPDPTSSIKITSPYGKTN